MPNIEEQIRRAMEEGKFNDLRGKGKPIQWDENPFVEPDWQMAFRTLHQAGFALPWMETRKEIETQLEAARTSLVRAQEWTQTESAAGQRPGLIAGEWQRAVVAFREQVTAINQRIFDYNLEVPLPRFQRPRVDAEAEITIVLYGEPADSSK